MAQNSSIEWTESTWNPVTGCTKISEGCQHCYAERMTKRLKAMGAAHYTNGFKLTTHRDALQLPLIWKKPQIIFVNSMSDLFHEDVPNAFIKDMFEVMRKAYWHKFQILTKRSERLLRLSKDLPWADNILMGVTVESEKHLDRVPHLRESGAKTRFLSLEPLLGPLTELNLKGIHWVIVGGESGPGARLMQADWVTGIRDKCVKASVPFFFKQWGGVRKKKAGRELDGKIYSQKPEILSV
jgi:protein gp37